MLSINHNTAAVKRTAAAKPAGKTFSFYFNRAVLMVLAVCGMSFSEGPMDLIFSDAVNEYFQPVIATEIITSNVPEKIIRNYNNGKFRSALVDLHRIIKLHLPDGREDKYLFLSAECYFQLGLTEKAAEQYQVINKYYPESKYTAEAMFRLMQIMHEDHSIEEMTRIYANMKNVFPQHKLVPAAAYLLAKSLVAKKHYEKAVGILNEIKGKKEFASSTRFLYALCLLWTGQDEAGLDSLKALSKDAKEQTISDECYLIAGNVYHKQEKFKQALAYYSKVPQSSRRYPLASLKKAMVYLSQRKLNEAITQARPVLKNKALFFEASLILQDAYWQLKDSTNAAIVRNRLVLQAKLTRLILLSQEEKLFIEQLKRRWTAFSNQPVNKKDTRDYLFSVNDNIQRKLDNVYKKLSGIDSKLSKYRLFDEPITTGGVLEKKLLELYKFELARLELHIEAVKMQYLQSKDIISDAPGGTEAADNPHKLILDSLIDKQTKLTSVIKDLYTLNQKLMEENLGASEAQPKFIDVGMILYERLKSRFHNANKNIRIYSKKRDSVLVLQKHK